MRHGVKEESLTALLGEIASQLEKGNSLDTLSLLNEKEITYNNKKRLITILLATSGITILGILLTWLIVRQMRGHLFILEPDTEIAARGGRVEFRGEMLLHPNAQLEIVHGRMR
jgi:hypothetical protein